MMRLQYFLFVISMNILLAILVCAFNANAAVSAGAIWYAISGSTSGNVNGCFYCGSCASAGTDYSTGTSAHSSGTDLSTTNGTTNPCTVHSGHAFTSDELRNGIHIASGGTFTAGWYEAVSLSGSDLVLDRACASTASTSSGVWKLGGACSLNSTLDDDMVESFTAGNKLCAKGALTLGEAMNSSVACTAAAPCIIEGYNSTCGDLPSIASGNQPVFTGGSGINLGAGGAFWYLKNVTVTGTASGGAISWGSNNSKVINVKATQTSSTAGRAALAVNASGIEVRGGEFVSLLGIALNNASGGAGLIIGNYIHHSDVCLQAGNGTASSFIVNNHLEQCLTSGIKETSAGTTGGKKIVSNTLYGSTAKYSGTAIASLTTSQSTMAYGNLIYGWTTGISHADANNDTYEDFNDFNNNTTARSNVATGANSSTTAPVFTNEVEYTDNDCTVSGSVITCTSSGFPTFDTAKDYVCIISGTAGPAVGCYTIASNTSSTITVSLPGAPGNSAVADHVVSILTGHDLGQSAATYNLGFPRTIGSTTSYPYPGAWAGQVPAASDVRSGTATGNTTGSLAVPAASQVQYGVSTDATTGTFRPSTSSGYVQ